MKFYSLVDFENQTHLFYVRKSILINSTTVSRRTKHA